MMNVKNTAAAALVGGSMLFAGLGLAPSAIADTNTCGGVSVSSSSQVRCSQVAEPVKKAPAFDQGLGAQGTGGKFAELQGRFNKAKTWLSKKWAAQGGLI